MARQARTLDLVQCQVTERTQWHFLVLRDGDRVAVGECSDSSDLASLVQRLPGLASRMRGADLVEEAGAIVSDAAREVRTARAAHAESADGFHVAHGVDAFVAATLLGGLEQVLCDNAAQVAGLSIGAWLGKSAPARIPVYANINRMVGGRRPGDVAQQAKLALADGFGGVKCAPFDVADAELPLAQIGIERLRAVRAAIGDDVPLMVDCHAKVPLADVLGLIPAFEDIGVAWLEDAVTIDDVDGLAQVRAATGLRIAGGEFMFDTADAAEVVERGLVDILMPDVKHAGGITRVLDIARALPSVEISPHNPSGPVATAASAQMFAAAPTSTVLEFQYGEAPWRSALVGGAEVIEDGHLLVPDAPGLGITLDLEHPSLTTLFSTTV